MKKGKVLCFGEPLLRFSPDANGYWINDNNLPVFVGGAELNVASALSNWGVDVKYCTAVPDNYLSDTFLRYAAARNIDISGVINVKGRFGTYYLRAGKEVKSNDVIYDRAESSFSKLTVGTIDWNKMLEGCSWFHFSAICPAINQNAAEVCKEALIAAHKKELVISVDLNYREKLWQYGKMPADVMPELVSYCDVVMGNIWSAKKMLGLQVNSLDTLEDTTQYLEAACDVSAEIVRLFPQCKTVANTFRFSNDRHSIEYYSALFKNGHLHLSQMYRGDNIVSKLGTGDCFMAALIYGIQQNVPAAVINDFAAAAAFGKFWEAGDATEQSRNEIDFIVKNGKVKQGISYNSL
jgi:2-dehydro-3-deoxygluconokinase